MDAGCPEKGRVSIPPLYNRPANLMRKMALVKRHIEDLKQTQAYYGWIFTQDPWFSEQLRLAEEEYSRLEQQHDSLLEGVTG